MNTSAFLFFLVLGTIVYFVARNGNRKAKTAKETEDKVVLSSSVLPFKDESKVLVDEISQQQKNAQGDIDKILADAETAAQQRKAQQRIEEAEQQQRNTQLHNKLVDQHARNNAIALRQFGSLNPTMFCPHCQTKGRIRTKVITQKKGVSGSKATAAVITGGLSVLAVGLSRKEASTQAHCENCSNTWLF